jgi:hypothetical protein
MIKVRTVMEASQVNIKENPPESKDLDVNQYERKST